jgi:phage baseplate assembly protein W
MANLIEQFNNLSGPVIDRTAGFFKIGNHIDLIKEGILRLIFTRKGTRMGNLDYGTTIPDLPFTANGEALLNIINFEISEALAKYEPRAQLISVQLADLNNEYVRFLITFRETVSNTTQELPVEASFV